MIADGGADALEGGADDGGDAGGSAPPPAAPRRFDAPERAISVAWAPAVTASETDWSEVAGHRVLFRVVVDGSAASWSWTQALSVA